MNKSYSNKRFWDDYWNEETRKEYEFIFSPILDKYVDWTHVANYMEIGGAPGTIMVYMYHNHQLDVNTIDFCNSSIISNLLDENHVHDYTIISEDFSVFNANEHCQKYDMVASWGFVEHFDIKTSHEFIQKHKEMVGEGGYLIIELPNIRRFNWLIYRIVNNNLLKIHDLQTMDLKYLTDSIEEGNQFEILYGDYYLTSFFDFSSSNEYFDRHRVIKNLFKSLKELLSYFHLDNIPNRFFSPYIVFIARRNDRI